MKKIISLVLTVAMVLSLMAVPVMASTVPEKDGAYYLIDSVEDFLYMAQEPAAKYKLTQDITIGTESAPFTEIFDFAGELDGNGKTITVYIQGSGAVGLFKSQPTAGRAITIKNLTLKGSVKRTDAGAADTGNGSDCSVGAFVGFTANHTTIKIENCVNYATVTGGAAGYYVGGFVGRVWGNSFSVISNSVNYGSVSSGHRDSHVGGIAGMWSGTITECANVGAVSKPDAGSYYAAGIVGMFRKGAAIEKTANFGPVSGVWTAGIVGFVNELDTSNGVKTFTVENSFNAGKITGNATNGGASGIVGTRNNLDTVKLTLTNNYNGGEITANRTAIFGCISCDNAATTTAKNQWYVGTYGTYARLPGGTFGQINSSNNTLAKLGFDESIWTWDTSIYPYPYITSVGLPNYDKGTIQNPYKVSTKADFLAINDNPTASYVVTNDINLGDYVPFTFKGHLKGQVKADGSYPVLTVAINQPKAVHVGLFKNVDGDVRIENIELAGSIIGGGMTGGFAGYVGTVAYDVKNETVAQGSYIKNCINRAKVSSLIDKENTDAANVGRYTAGFVGYYYNGSGRNLILSNLVNYGDIYSAKSHAAGILANGKTSISNCANYGYIYSDNCVAGIIGFGYDNRPVTKCFNAGNIKANSSVAGIVGRWQHPGNGTVIENCYNVGNIIATDVTSTGSIGTILGDQIGSGAANIKNAYNAGTLNGEYVSRPVGVVAVANTLTNVYSLTFDGDADEDAATIGFAGLKNADLGSAFTASTNAYQFPQIAGNTYDKAFDVIMLDEVNMGDYEGKAWDVVITSFDGANDYVAAFTADEEEKDGALDFSGVEADGGSIAFAILLHTSKANVALDIVAE